MLHRRLILALIVATALCIGPFALAAQAHVNVSSSNATPGKEAIITFRVPTEKDVATTKFEVALPTDTPITQVSFHPKPGWTYEVVTAAPAVPVKDEMGNAVTEVASRVTWTATGDGIKPGEYDQFDILADPLPDASQLVFKALQTYADGSVVSWIQVPVAGASEPEFPAPTLALTAAAASGTGADVTASTGSAAPGTAGDDLVWKLAVAAALVLALAALLGALYAMRRASAYVSSGAARASGAGPEPAVTPAPEPVTHDV